MLKSAYNPQSPKNPQEIEVEEQESDVESDDDDFAMPTTTLNNPTHTGTAIQGGTTQSSQSSGVPRSQRRENQPSRIPSQISQRSNTIHGSTGRGINVRGRGGASQNTREIISQNYRTRYGRLIVPPRRYRE